MSWKKLLLDQTQTDETRNGGCCNRKGLKLDRTSDKTEHGGCFNREGLKLDQTQTDETQNGGCCDKEGLKLEVAKRTKNLN